MADSENTSNTPENLPNDVERAARSIARFKRLTPQQAFRVVADTEHAIAHSKALTDGLIHLAACSQTMEEPDKVTVGELATVILEQVESLDEARTKLWHGLHHFLQSSSGGPGGGHG